ncbi:branched-chain amino acid transport system ATP-binding protein [Tistlia consotensis]|uniref:Branched-chain amino acid transport system ATP-binding protein n=1 Tax=Tistlia consotensis USBA 355 TaxID=560819 RepID=A0A1Y6C0N7_9PROT|nr:ABC transporter ATP-binding protein [Tistlia consotensis]SMF30271.1 branched-chain amino acid transport system ATP-binding protein [Tistlia consotensis USBA 355]SNR90243.1 branched-chain amino acid transport system ATP-binding protein [Tistlia consotensis]
MSRTDSAAAAAETASGTEVVLAVRGLGAGYGRKRVVHDVSLALGEREVLLMLGHNGAGKTTLLRAIFGLGKPMGGSVSYHGRDITGRKAAENVTDGLAYVPQGHGVFRTLSVADNLELGGFVEPRSALLAERRERVFELFPILAERRSQTAGTLSGGQQQMLAIGMALMHEPRVILLDEPSIGLAPNLVERVMQAVVTINRTMGVAILMVEQNVQLSLPIAQRALVLKTGAVVYDGPPDPLRDHVELMKLF